MKINIFLIIAILLIFPLISVYAGDGTITADDLNPDPPFQPPGPGSGSNTGDSTGTSPGGTSPGTSTGLSSPPQTINIADLGNRIVTILMQIATPLAIIMVIIAGYYFMTAQGDPNKIDIAKKIILWVIIGLAIALMAKALVNMVQGLVT